MRDIIDAASSCPFPRSYRRRSSRRRCRNRTWHHSRARRKARPTLRRLCRFDRSDASRKGQSVRLRAGGGSRACRGRSISSVKGFVFLHEPGPSLTLFRTRRLLKGDREIGDLAIDFLARQDVQPRDREWQIRGRHLLARLNPSKGACCSLCTILQWNRGRCGSTSTRVTFSSAWASAPARRGTGTFVPATSGQSCRPVTKPGEYARVIGIVGDGERIVHEIVERCRGTKRRDDPALARPRSDPAAQYGPA